MAPRRTRGSGVYGSTAVGKWLVVGVVLVNVTLTGFLVSRYLARKPLQQVVIQRDPQSSVITVTVMNGCGVSGIAQQTRNFLQDHKFSVIDYGNWKDFEVARTVVWDCFSAQKENARQVAKVLGLGEDAVIARLDPNSRAQVVVLLGRDYPRLIPFRQ
ncbi:MAG: LytR C-terminal domain-containing protein [Candidatus Oleimicrobiaceae bacterium]